MTDIRVPRAILSHFLNWASDELDQLPDICPERDDYNTLRHLVKYSPPL